MPQAADELSVFLVSLTKEENVETIKPVSLESIDERDVEQTADFLVLQLLEDRLQVMHITSQERIVENVVDQIVDVPVDVVDESVEVVRWVPKE